MKEIAFFRTDQKCNQSLSNIHASVADFDSSERLQTDASEVWKLFFEVYLTLDINKTIRLQILHCKII